MIKHLQQKKSVKKNASWEDIMNDTLMHMCAKWSIQRVLLTVARKKVRLMWQVLIVHALGYTFFKSVNLEKATQNY